jgi:hypothetical protein
MKKYGILREYSAGILQQSMGARNRVGIGLSYWSARLHRLAESIPELLKSLKIQEKFSLLSSWYSVAENHIIDIL